MVNRFIYYRGKVFISVRKSERVKQIQIYITLKGKQKKKKKSRIRETLNLSTDADHRTDIYTYIIACFGKTTISEFTYAQPIS